MLAELRSLLPKRLCPCRELLHAAVGRRQAFRYGGASILQPRDVPVKLFQPISQALQALLEAGAQVVILSAFHGEVQTVGAAKINITSHNTR